ncbi:MAG: tetratricopeptide repeat protein [Gemmatimonadetes bacterium]|nr:tetratricopeptide repeat protein [Gemmatimonadota bacterium]
MRSVASYSQQAEAAALKAIRLDDELAEPHVSLGRVRAAVHWDFAGAERDFKRAIELSPKAAQAHSWYGLLLRTMGRCDEAIAETIMAVELEPFEPAYPNNLGNALYCARRYDEAVKQYLKATEMAPDFASSHNGLGITYLAQGRFDAAIAEFDVVRQLNPAGAVGFLGYAYAKVGRRVDALQFQRELELRPSTATRPSSGLAIIAMGLGDHDRALELLENAVETREIRIEAPRYAVWDPVRSHPRFVALVRKMGLEP